MTYKCSLGKSNIICISSTDTRMYTMQQLPGMKKLSKRQVQITAVHQMAI